jgi:hypothetical protein
MRGGEILIEQHTPDQFKHDVKIYARYMEKKFRSLRLVGVVQKDHGERHPDPELEGIFVPLRVAVQSMRSLEKPLSEGEIAEKPLVEEKMFASAAALLKEHSHLALLGDPGSGKSTLLRYFAWEHAATYTKKSVEMSSLTQHPLPLYVELRTLTEERRMSNKHYDFLQYSSALLQRNSAQFDPDKLERPLDMFEALLKHNALLLLLDGLDEVATLDERHKLVQEIEDFVQRYPAMRVIVTSRPVGYELASLSRRLFAQAQVQNFNAEQIQLFLHHWYKSVLRLDPLPYDDEQELRVLSTALLENARLHKLAENPLLLTVITALHRYERLPDRRVQVYDRCAELLLDVWAKRKGTDKRWQDIKMNKEDQYACVAYLGFILHKRSQEKSGTESSSERVDDVPELFLLQLIEQFLSDQKLMADEAEQHIEAERFLELMKVEAGLILERGTNQDGELLYGFIHRTFQEYFAAISIYNQYQQEESPEIIKHFLKENLHDPHWHEVILLLLGKLLRKPVTTQLRNILLGQTKSNRSAHTELLQQDLFFVCECLTEEIAVESDLVELINERLCERIIHSLFAAQRTRALDIFASFMRTRQYAIAARKALYRFLIGDSILHQETKIQAYQLLYQSSPTHSEEKVAAFNILLDLLQQERIPFDEALSITENLLLACTGNSEEWYILIRQYIEWLNNVSHHGDFYNIMGTLLDSFLGNKDRERIVFNLLFDLIESPDVSPAFVIYFAEWRRDIASSGKSVSVMHILLDIAQRTTIPFEQGLQAVKQVMYLASLPNEDKPLISPLQSPDVLEIDERRQAMNWLLRSIQRSDLTFEQYIKGLLVILKSNPQGAQEYQDALSICWQLAQRSNLSVEETLQVAEVFYKYGVQKSKEHQYAFYALWNLAQQSKFSVKDHHRIFSAFYDAIGVGEQYYKKNEDNKQATQLLLNLVQQPGIPLGQKIQIAQSFYRYIPPETEEYQQATQWLAGLAQQSEISFEETIQLADTLDRGNSLRELSIQILLDFREQRALSIEEDFRILLQLYSYIGYSSVLHEQIVEELLALVAIVPVDVEHSILVAQAFLRARFLSVDTKVNKHIQPERKLGPEILLKLIEYPDLSFEQALKIMRLLYTNRFLSRMEGRVTHLLWQIAQSQDLTLDQRLQITIIPFNEERVDNYPDIVKAVQVVLNMLDPEEAKHYFKEHLTTKKRYPRPMPSDIPYVIKLIEQDLLPMSIRETLYRLLSREVPRFNMLEGQRSVNTNNMII